MDNNTNPMPNPMPNPAPEPTPEPTPNPDQASNPAPEAAPAMPVPEAAPAMNNPESMSAPAGAPIAPVAAPAIPNNMGANNMGNPNNMQGNMNNMNMPNNMGMPSNMLNPAPSMPNGNQNNQTAPANGEKKKSNKGVIIGLCVGLGVIVIALVVTLIIVINNNNASKAVSNNGGNHYEKPDEDDGDDDGDDDEDTVACMGFKFNQVKGYEYKCVSGDPSGLVASSDTHQVELQLINDTYANLRANVQNLALQLSGSFQIDRYGTWNSKDGDEMIIFRVAAENITAYLFLAKANSTSTFFGSVQNSTGIAAESDLETALKIIDESDSPASRLNADLLKDQITGDGTVKNIPTTFPSSN